MTKPDPRQEQQKLDALQRRIDDRRRELHDMAPEETPAARHGGGAAGPTDADDEPRFLDTGQVETDKVDNTIVPPG